MYRGLPDRRYADRWLISTPSRTACTTGRRPGRRADRRLAPDPRPPRARLRGALRARAADRRSSRTRASRSSGAPTGSTPRSSAGPARQRPDDRGALRVRRAARHRPRLRPQHHRHRRRSARAWPRPRWPTSWAAGSSILGTPAEEGGGGKVADGRARRVRRRRRRDDGAPGRRRPARDGRHRHPAARRSSTTAGRRTPRPLPQEGRNALDAAVLGYMNVAALRQHIRPDRAHPRHLHRGRRQAEHRARARAAAEWYVRSPTARARSQPLKARVLDLPARPARRGRVHDGATSGRIRPTPTCVDNAADARRCTRRTPTRTSAARSPTRTPTRPVVGSTDMGNVSYLVPSIHPMIQVSPPNVADPHAGVRRLRRRRGGRPGGARRGQGAWP